ncbi:Hypothetical protein NTJ_10435 [Nesidiocoris tenuis]|uniref:Protein N-terminal glutamine amidohydrolase n=1 Tax=Nesidiocoris tenuis TaxID=355587 RepID=A0ABN7B365_9HEMI|nr:Hypothetical protein NTJ_10435 [Nesidiocoris tenuis]
MEDILSWKKENFMYTKCYCEENIWKLCEKLKGSEILKKSYAVFISNDERRIPLWNHSGREDMDYLSIWDYHVILLVKLNEGSYVVDFDTILGFVLRLEDYNDQVIRDEENLADNFKRKFRVIPAASYLEVFASDRSHMLRKDGNDASYLSPPPPYPPLRSRDSTNNIQEFISMSDSNEYGEVFDLRGFLRFFGKM